MTTIRSKITAQGQISVPAPIRKKLGLTPGSVIEWEDEGDEASVTVKKATEYDLDDLHKNVFPDGPPKPISIDEIDKAIDAYLRKKHAGR
ncbi:MAG: AbrB/MazE/SpoVT family DNA-binding domain-containing protein [Pyrinomonadaceae bacterium]|nr:AbrB/MazE/SpoVT family DNA-binding domain-containing protein [Pyrinomonadaceae bacterium]